MDKIIAKKALTPNDCQLTESESNECPEFATSKAKANTNASIADKTNTSLAIAKLCTYIGDKPTREAINTTLTSYTPAEVRAFFADVLCNNNISNAPDNTRSMCNFVNNFTVAIVEAWKICKDARPTTSSIRLDWDILQSVVDYSNNPNLQAGLTITKTTDTTPNRFLKILKEYSGECNTCLPGNATVCERLPKMNIYLNRLKEFTLKYGNKTDFDDFITGEATASSPNKQDGAYHLMRHLNNSSYLASDVVSFEGNINSKIPVPRPTAICNCKYDVEKPGGILVDYKSYDCNSPLGNPNQFKQYLQYWSATPPTRTFEYVFNADKVNLQQAKQKVVNLIATDPTGFYNANPAFFQNFRYNGLVITAPILQTACQDSSFWQNSLFSFVSITP